MDDIGGLKSRERSLLDRLFGRQIGACAATEFVEAGAPQKAVTWKDGPSARAAVEILVQAVVVEGLQASPIGWSLRRLEGEWQGHWRLDVYGFPTGSRVAA